MGLSLYNAGAALPMNVSVSRIVADNNEHGNISIESKGNITLSNVSANYSKSGSNGVNLNNKAGTGNVTITGSNSFSHNDGSGLIVETDGAVTIRGVLAQGNTKDGINVESGGAGKNFILQDITAHYNGQHGVFAETDGTITVTNVKAFLNGQGIYVDANGKLIRFNSCVFMGNGGYDTGSGIHAVSDPAIVILVKTIAIANEEDIIYG